MINSGMHAPIRELGTLFNEGAVGMLSDGRLLDRFVERREASAFEAIVERYGTLVWGVCRRVLRDHHDAEDAFQATFLVLARKAASVMPREKLGNWLYGVAFQTAMKTMATRAKRRVRERQVREMPEPEAVPHKHADELLARLDREMDRLPEKYRMPIILCELQGNTHRQTAEQLGWPVGTVSGRLSRARAILARRLSRPGTPLTTGGLGVLLAHDVARAGMPPELVRSTAHAASLSTAGKAVTAGVVSARVAGLTGEVLKTMLIKKLTFTTTILLVAVALTAGGTCLTYRADAGEPANQQKDSEKPKEHSTPVKAAQEDIPPPAEQSKAAEGPKADQPKPAEAPKDEIPPPGEQPKPAEGTKEEIPPPRDHPKAAEASKEDIPPPKDTAAVPDEDPPSSPLSEEGWQSHQRKVGCGAYTFTALRTGKAALAYNASTREVKAVRLHSMKDDSLWVTPVVVGSTNKELVALGVKGSRITRVALFNLKSGKWTPLDLDQPVNGAVWPMSFGPDTVAYEVGDFLYLYNPKRDGWDRLDLRTIAEDKQEVGAIKVR